MRGKVGTRKASIDSWNAPYSFILYLFVLSFTSISDFYSQLTMANCS